MIDLPQLQRVLATRMPWPAIQASLAQRRARQMMAGKKIEHLDLCGPVSAVTGGGVLQCLAAAFSHPADGGKAVTQACRQ